MKKLMIALALGVSLSASNAALAQTPFYEGKTITVFVGFNPASGTDLFARLISDNLGQYVEGNPTIIVENMPGSGGIIASNHVVRMDHSDGLNVLAGTGQLMMRMVLGLEGSQGSISDFDAMLSVPMGRVTYAHASTGLTSGAELSADTEGLFLGVPEVISTLDAVLGLQLLETPFERIVGYEGKPDTRIAFERGEINIDSQTSPFYNDTVLPLVENGDAVPLFSQGLMVDGTLERDPAVPNVPTILEVYSEIHGENPSGPVWDAYVTAVTAMGNGGKILLVPSDFPQAAKDALEAGIEAMVSDPAFLERAEARIEGYPILTGEGLQTTVRAISGMSDESVTWFRDMLSRDYDMQFD